MEKLPKQVDAAVKALKSELKRYIFPKASGDKYYLYSVTTKWIKEQKKRKTITTYLGILTKDGTFIKRKPKASGLKTAEEEPHFTTARTKLPDQEDSQLLTILSMNARADLSFLCRKLMGLKPSAAFYKVKQLEKEYGITYTAEVDPEKLGFTEYIALIKFEGNMPSVDTIKKELGRDERVQLVAFMTGVYDLFVYFLAENNSKATDTIYRLRRGELSGYPSKWYITPFKSFYGCVKIRECFFKLLSDNLKQKEEARGANTLKKRDIAVLSELTSDGGTNLASIDEKYGLGKNAAYYTYTKLRESGVIKRITIGMNGLPIKYNAVFLVDIINPKSYEKARENLRCEVINDWDPRVNNFVMEGDIGIPNGVLFIAPIFSDDQFNKLSERLGSIMGGAELRRLIITEVVIGGFCYRKFDNAYSIQHALLVKENKMTPLKEIDYLETEKGKRPAQQKGLRGELVNRDDINLD